MASKEFNLLIEQGQDHTYTLDFSNSGFSLVGYNIGEMQIRKTCASETVDLELNVTNGKITIDDISQKVIFRISDDDSFLLQNNSVYDLFIENTSLEDRRRILFGKVTVECAVTRT